MKFVFPNSLAQPRAVDEWQVATRVLRQDSGHMLVDVDSSFTHIEVFSTQRDLIVPFSTRIPHEALWQFAAELVEARLVAKLAAPHVSTIVNDHAEFVTCVLLEMRDRLQSVSRLDAAYVQDWLNSVAGRVTAGWIEEDNAHTLCRTAADRWAIYRPAGQVQSSLMLRQYVANTLREFTVYRGTSSECQAALLKVKSVPYQEAITRIETDRWVQRHTAVDESTDSATTGIPYRSITIPDQTAR